MGMEMQGRFEPGRKSLAFERCPWTTRREFLKLTVATSLVVGAGADVWPAETKNGILYRTLGRTGEKVSAIGVGGFHIGEPKDEQEGIRMIRNANDGGINFMENCW